MSPHEKPEKRKPEKRRLEKAKSDTTPAGLRPGLERRLRAALPEKTQQSNKLVTFEELAAAAKQAKNKFTMASLEIMEYAHIEKTKSSDEAIKFAQAVEKEIAAQLRQDDLIANTGAGKFIVYLPETARIESTMVMERLSRQICKKNSKRSCAQQISLSFQLLPAETAADENLQNEEEQRLNQWLSRYKSVSVAPMASFGQTISARDLWKDSRKVSIKRFDFQSKVTQTIKKNIIEILLTIQENGLALMPRLFDFHISDNYLCLVMDPHSDCPAEQFTSLKSIHPLLISVCDLFLQLDSFSIAAPVISTSKFKISHGDHETVLDSLDAHLIDALLSKPADEQTACTKAVDSFSNLIDELSEKVGTDDCFSESQKHLKNITSRKNFGSHLQKLRAILKRHEERLRRIEAIGLEGGK